VSGLIVFNAFYLRGTMSPVLISLVAAALTLVGVRRFSLPICRPLSANEASKPSPIYIVILSPHPRCLHSGRCVRGLRDVLSQGKLSAIGVERDRCGSLVHSKEILNLAKSTLGCRSAVCHDRRQ